jgi:hypothetical protein
MLKFCHLLSGIILHLPTRIFGYCVTHVPFTNRYATHNVIKFTSHLRMLCSNVDQLYDLKQDENPIAIISSDTHLCFNLCCSL